MPMEPTKLPQRLVNSFKWAQVCVEWADEQNLLAWVGTMKELPYSTWFSGHGCAELGLAMLAGALRKVGKGGGDSFLPSYEFEISAKARGATVDRIPEHCCQYVDILRMLNESSRKSLQELEATCPKVSEDVWTFLLKQEFVYEQLCPRHRNRCSVPRTVLDISGSMCKGFSTLGKKDQGGLLREESQYNKLLLAWAIAHGRAETPILIHENVRGFSSSYLAGKLEHFHYRHVSTIKTTGSDCGLHANSRKRVYDVFILDKYMEQVLDPAQVYSNMVNHLQSVLEPVPLEDVAWMEAESFPHELRQEMLENCNQNCALDRDKILHMDMSDWRVLLSSSEQANYRAYLKDLGQADLPKESRPIRAVCVSQDPSFINMGGSPEKLPAFTTDSTRRIMLTSKERWLTAAEKMAITGFPVHKELGEAALVPVVPVDSTGLWHRGVGNGMIVGNVGMIALSVLVSLKPKPLMEDAIARALRDRDLLGMPKELRFHNGWKKWRLEVGETTHSFTDKSQARAAATWLQQCKHQLELESGKALQEELKVAGVPRKRNKEDLVKSILRLRYKAENRGCICCSGLQTSKEPENAKKKGHPPEEDVPAKALEKAKKKGIKQDLLHTE
ncbi:unnamed protein product, partial [Durusdinium trenchii]